MSDALISTMRNHY